MLHFSLIQLVYAFMHCTFCYILTAVCFDRFTLLRCDLSPWEAFLRLKQRLYAAMEGSYSQRSEIIRKKMTFYTHFCGAIYRRGKLFYG